MWTVYRILGNTGREVRLQAFLPVNYYCSVKLQWLKITTIYLSHNMWNVLGSEILFYLQALKLTYTVSWMMAEDMWFLGHRQRASLLTAQKAAQTSVNMLVQISLGPQILWGQNREAQVGCCTPSSFVWQPWNIETGDSPFYSKPAFCPKEKHYLIL